VSFLYRQVILFDESHEELLKLDRIKKDKDWDSWTRLKEFLTSLPCRIIQNRKAPISDELLENVDVLIFGCPRVPFNQDEIKTIINFVKNGGSLFVMNNYGGDLRNNNNLSKVLQEFGMAFRNDQVFDPEHNIHGYKYGLVIQNFNNSPLLFNIDEFYYLIGCSLKVFGNARVIASSSTASYHKLYDSNQKWTRGEETHLPVLATSELENGGRIVAIGEFNLFSDDDFGLIMPSNKMLFKNILSWLLEPKMKIEERLDMLNLKMVEVTREISNIKRILRLGTVEKNGTRKLYSKDQLAIKVTKLEKALEDDSEEIREIEKTYYQKRVKYEFYAILISIISIVAVFISILISILF